MVTYIWVNIGSGNGLVPYITKPSPEPMLIYHQWGPLAFKWEKVHRNSSVYHSLKSVENYIFENTGTSPRGQWAGLILGLPPANERRRYFVTTSLIGWAQT